MQFYRIIIPLSGLIDIQCLIPCHIIIFQQCFDNLSSDLLQLIFTAILFGIFLVQVITPICTYQWEYIPRDERLITIEDNAELRIRGIDNLVRLEAKMANMEGAVSVTIRDLIKSALRMRPDRIIVGEVRGGEAMDMLQALNTGHEGSLSTAHANSARDMLSRLETMVLMGVDLPLEAIRRQIASGVDILVHLGRMRDKSRKLLEVTEVCGFENGEIRIRPLYQWQEGKGLVKTASLLHVEKLERAGIEL